MWYRIMGVPHRAWCLLWHRNYWALPVSNLNILRCEKCKELW